MRRRLAGFLAVGVAASLAAALWGFWLEPSRFHNADHPILLPSWPAECEGFRVAVLADLHVGSPYNGLEKLAQIVDRTQRARPDLILLAGDYVIHGVVGGRFTDPERIAAELAELSAPAGVYAVLGNHDWWFDPERIHRAFANVAIPTLEDDSVSIRHGACRFWLAGITDHWEGPSDVDAALRDVPAGAPALAFTHNPDVFPSVPDRILLTIAGHTHGGQVLLPLLGRPVVPSRYGERYAIGHVVEDGKHLFVSPGLGTSIIPVRFRVPPEISVLKLRGSAP